MTQLVLSSYRLDFSAMIKSFPLGCFWSVFSHRSGSGSKTGSQERDGAGGRTWGSQEKSKRERICIVSEPMNKALLPELQ